MVVWSCKYEAREDGGGASSRVAELAGGAEFGPSISTHDTDTLLLLLFRSFLGGGR